MKSHLIVWLNDRAETRPWLRRLLIRLWLDTP